eukprot:SAG31_NODE_42324_length_272_cov_0.601156_1_plen_90_part_11
MRGEVAAGCADHPKKLPVRAYPLCGEIWTVGSATVRVVDRACMTSTLGAFATPFEVALEVELMPWSPRILGFIERQLGRVIRARSTEAAC